MVASTAAGFPRSATHFTRNADGTGGFIDVMACVTTAGECKPPNIARSELKGFSHKRRSPRNAASHRWTV